MHENYVQTCKLTHSSIAAALHSIATMVADWNAMRLHLTWDRLSLFEHFVLCGMGYEACMTIEAFHFFTNDRKMFRLKLQKSTLFVEVDVYLLCPPPRVAECSSICKTYLSCSAESMDVWHANFPIELAALFCSALNFFLVHSRCFLLLSRAIILPPISRWVEFVGWNSLG